MIVCGKICLPNWAVKTLASRELIRVIVARLGGCKRLELEVAK